ncbi:MAG: two-component sensor histidine kinase [Acidiphilium sp. 37-64-53]|uniref:ATP-binding protein n=1 Tax=Acidiphilium TaxID=522 RepID=UPI000BD328D9|nr:MULTISPECIES: ATP-binding protein [Acidiphilium]OYW01059.1 MAG: two-component sensor histidine kinase [Acidiphilium sp. 37-64-53]OZB24656.1 MAG: two-component sensor histidine kinase [Acidiphilium sp. 34-64-41]HQT86819.1 ATP-binding protein [Acidiphilium rubrum]
MYKNRLRLWPASLAWRTALTLLAGFAVVQAIGLGIHTINQIGLNNIIAEREIATRDAIFYRRIAMAPPDRRPAIVAAETGLKGDKITLDPIPPFSGTFPLPLPSRQIIRGSILAFPIPPEYRPRNVVMRGSVAPPRSVLSFRLPDGGWLTIESPFHPTPPWETPGFATAFLVMFGLGAIMIFWAVFRLTAPVRTLADAAEQLGRDIQHAPALPESGPTEIATAAIAFNTMASRVRRFVEDRTFLLSAIGHDLRTPITRLKLRTEFLEDDAQREKFLGDLDELEAMLASTLAFGRDVAQTEASVPVDLAILLRTVIDETADIAPECSEALRYAGPPHSILRARPLALKRAFANLIGNAVKYGESARVTLRDADRHTLRIDIEDDGPGIPPGELERVFEPFRRVENSRNRETGGTGLGLAIARNAIRAHGGDITLANRSGGKGLIASVYLPT